MRHISQMLYIVKEYLLRRPIRSSAMSFVVFLGVSCLFPVGNAYAGTINLTILHTSAVAARLFSCAT
ncbi:MAG: hypothetical protein NTY64_15020 [Deltaproteobacteria bacterium]|nr:hypothetical protein [Deltaproteobacteria bacterium]